MRTLLMTTFGVRVGTLRVRPSFVWRAMVLIVLTVDPVGASRCNGQATPGPRNLHPIDTALPTLVKEVQNGKLFSIGHGSDRKDLVHLWGTPYENGLAMGHLIGSKITRVILEGYVYMESQIVAKAGNATWCAAHGFECKALRAVTKLGLKAALDLSYRRTAPFVKPYVMEEIRGIVNGTAGALSVTDLRDFMWLGELTRGSCSMFGAKGAATASRDGRLLQLRALDWDVDGPFKNHAVVVIYHPNKGDGQAWANFAFAGFTASVTGFNAAQLGLSEIGVAFPDASFGPEAYFAAGYPFGFLIRDVLQFDSTLEQATDRITGATRTCDLILGVGDGKANDFTGFRYSPSAALPIKPVCACPAS